MARGGGPRTGARGLRIAEDFTTWDYWWEFNKNPYLRLRDGVRSSVATGGDDFYLGATRAIVRDTLRPTPKQTMESVVPALKRALDSSSQRDITTACMVALAKIGRDHPQFDLLDEFRERLDENDQEVRETAALAIGIAGRADDASLALLVGLVRDDDVGRAASGGAVNARTRSFAAYALGLTAHSCERVEVKRRCFDALLPFVTSRDMVDRDVKVAVIGAFGLLAFGDSYEEQGLRRRALDALEDYFLADLGAGAEFLQAHAALAIARLGDGSTRGRFVHLFGDELRAKGTRRRGNAIHQSSVQALGKLANADEHAEACALLHEVSREHRDAMTRRFALMSMARIGGRANREALLREFDGASKTQRRPWCALALGVLARGAREANDGAADDLIVRTLRDEFEAARQPGLVGALAVAIGLSADAESTDVLVDRLRGERAQQKMAGYLCIGLALIGDARAAEEIRAAMDEARFRPTLMVQAALALGRLGDRDVNTALLARMDGNANLATLAACASALAQIGDRRSVEPLLARMLDGDLSALPRAFAAAALGGVCDRRALPWNTPLSIDVNYRANVPTLSDAKAGVIDIL